MTGVQTCALPISTQNLRIVKIFNDKNIIFVKGAIPGANNSYIEIKLAKKKKVSEDRASGTK